MSVTRARSYARRTGYLPAHAGTELYRFVTEVTGKLHERTRVHFKTSAIKTMPPSLPILLWVRRTKHTNHHRIQKKITITGTPCSIIVIFRWYAWPRINSAWRRQILPENFVSNYPVTDVPFWNLCLVPKVRPLAIQQISSNSMTLWVIPLTCRHTQTQPDRKTFSTEVKVVQYTTYTNTTVRCSLNKLCAWRHDIPRPSPPPALAPRASPNRRNVAVVSHAQYVLTVTTAPASRVKAAVSKAAWPLTFWPWQWCPSHVWRGLPLCQFWSS